MVHYNMDKAIVKKVTEKNVKKLRRRGCGGKMVEFCNRTDLHGYKYIVMEELNTFERCCWAVAVVVSIGCAAYFVTTAYKWYARNPIVTVIESTQGAIWDVPFPAVTICDLSMVSKKAALFFSKNVSLPKNVTSDDVYHALRYIPKLYTPYAILEKDRDYFNILQTVLDLNFISIKSLIKQVSPAESCSRILERCMWKNTMYRCEHIFRQIYTVMGVCCSFNFYSVGLEFDVSISSDRPSESDTLPRKVASCGYQTALAVLLYSDLDDYYSSHVASQGSLVFIDNSYNYPDLDSPVRMVNPSTELLIALSPETTYATAGMKSFSPDMRQCYYGDEIKIGNFAKYSFHNCMSFKRTSEILKVCDCVPYFFPMRVAHRICNFHDIDCSATISNVGETKFSDSAEGEVACLPECEHFDYPLEVALGKLTLDVKLNGIPFFSDMNMVNRSMLNVFFNDLVSTRFRRDVYLNWQNILSSFGGLLGLMLGFTLVSGFDLILFFVFRIAYDFLVCYWRDKKENKAPIRKNMNYSGTFYQRDYWTLQNKNGWMDQFNPKNRGADRMKY